MAEKRNWAQKNYATVVVVGVILASIWFVGIPMLEMFGVIEPASIADQRDILPAAVYGDGITLKTEEQGKAVTLTTTCYDEMADSKTAITTTVFTAESGEAGDTDYIPDETPSSGLTSATYTRSSTGEQVMQWFGNATIHGDSPIVVNLKTEQETAECTAYTRQTEANMRITCRDTNNQALDAYTNTTRADYNVSLGAAGSKTIICQFENTAANAGFVFSTVCTGYANDMTTADLQGETRSEMIDEYWATKGKLDENKYSVGSWTQDIMAKHVGGSKTTIGSFTYKACWTRDDPLVIPEYASVYLQFKIGATADPTYTATLGDEDAVIILMKDASWSQGEDGYMDLDYYAHTDAQADVGLDETEVSPQGLQTGAVIVGI